MNTLDDPIAQKPLWLLIQNYGLMEIESLYLMGASTKRGDEAMLGYYGTGAKNSIASMLRMHIDFRIFIGEQEVEITTRPVEIRGVNFDIIRINGNDTSLTIQMAPQWEPWFIIREIYSNAIDEGNPVIVETNDINPSAIHTRFYIRIDSTIREVLAKWDTYFCFDRSDLLFDSPVSSYPLRVYPNLDVSQYLLVYRRGILVSEGKSYSAYSYDMPTAQIDEMRVLKDTWYLRSHIAVAWMSCTRVNLVEEFLIAMDNRIRKGEELTQEFIEEDVSWHSYDYHMNTEVWKKAIGDRIIINKSHCGAFQEEQLLNSLILPNDLCKAIADKLPTVPIYGVSNAHGIMFVEVELTKRHHYKMQKVIEALEELEIPVAPTIKVVKFVRENQEGLAKDGRIYLSSKLLETGSVRDIALVILEENIHVMHGYEDMSRDMQNLLLDNWLQERELRYNKYLF
jgi:hypothetical protein